MQIDQKLGFWLFQAHHSMMSALADILQAHCLERTKPYIITPPQWGILALLNREDGQTIGALAQKLYVDPPAITGLVTRMEKIGLVERLHNGEDRRVVNVYLTQEGHNITRTLIPVVKKFYQKIMSSQEQLALTLQLQELVADIKTKFPKTFEKMESPQTQQWLQEKVQ
jgi:DNA-binding MarR family transcriptional regulator